MRSSNDYEFIEIIGKGSFGDVFKVIRKSDNKKIALKTIEINDNPRSGELVTREIDILTKLSNPQCNPFIVCYYGSFTGKDVVYIEMELV